MPHLLSVSLPISSSLSLTILLSMIVRWGISLYPYSGYGKPPMYGDYEAQRHWMEITHHLPVGEWYFNSSQNDLQYWGLDYPPLTAYHSKILGALAETINPSWVHLHESRGHESYHHKLFMRYSVIVADLLIYIPAILLFFMKGSTPSGENQKIASVILALFYPGLMLIDHGHFQYNSISLGFTLWAIIALEKSHDIIGSIFFCFALNYKQMELYHAMPFFCYLLGRCITAKTWLKSFLKLLGIGLTVIYTFILCWFPFLTSIDSVKQVAHRLFPFERGIFEDKVANFWCSLSIFFKIKHFPMEKMASLSLLTTLAALLPTSLHLLMKPHFMNFKISLANASLVFFLFSFQVHEKSILLAALPVCLLIPDEPLMSCWFLIISTFSMFPLFIKDQLIIPYFALQVLFITLLMNFHPINLLRPKLPQVMHFITDKVKYLFILSMIGAAVLSMMSLIVVPPARYPDLWPVLVSAYASGHFMLFLIYFSWYQITNGIETQGGAKQKKKLKAKKDL